MSCDRDPRGPSSTKGRIKVESERSRQARGVPGVARCQTVRAWFGHESSRFVMPRHILVIYHMRTSLHTSSSQTRTDHSTWDPDLIGVVENPADSSLFRRQAGPECINTMKHWGLRHIRRGAHFAPL